MGRTSAAQNQYYVSPQGSDSNDGSAAHPWATIQHADSALVLGPGGAICGGTNIGACVHVAPGTYSSSISTSKSGTAGARIRFISDTQYGAKMNASNSPLWSINGAFSDIVGFDFDGSGHPGVQNGVVAYAHNVLVKNSKLHDMASGCNSTSTAVLESASAGSPGAGNDFESNLIYHNNCGAGQSSFSGNSNSAISFHSYDTAKNNIILDHGSGYALQSSHDATHTTITNNVIANVDCGMIIGFTSVTNDFTTVSNNIVVNAGGGCHNGGIRVNSSGCGSHNVYANNLMYGNSPSNYVFDSGCPDTSTGTQSGSNSTTFANYTGTVSGDYHLKSGSAGIDHGTIACAAASSCIPSVDIAGNLRPQGLAVDIGAYEVGVGGSTDAPAAPTGLTALVQ